MSIGVTFELAHDEVKWEGGQLLDTADRDVALFSRCLTRRLKLVVHLAGAEDEALDIGAHGGVGRAIGLGDVHDEALEADPNDVEVVGLVIKLKELRPRLRVAQKVLWGEDDEGLPEGAVDLQGVGGVCYVVD